MCNCVIKVYACHNLLPYFVSTTHNSMYWKSVPDKGEKIATVRGLRYLWLNWRLASLYPINTHKIIYYIYAFLTISISLIGMPATMLINLAFVQNVEELISNLTLSITVLMVTVKHAVLYYFRKPLLNVQPFLAELDERSNSHPADRQHLLKAIRLCEVLYVSFMVWNSMCAYGFSVIAYRHKTLVYNAWMPPLFKDTHKQFLFAFIYQNLGQTFSILQNSNNDLYPLSYITLMIAHLRALYERINRLSQKSDNREELVRCIKDHKTIMRYFALLHPIISGTMFIQCLATAFVLCITTINVIFFAKDLLQLILLIFYVGAILIQIFPCCWFASKLTVECSKLTVILFHSKWYHQSPNFIRTMLMFMQRSQQEVHITAAGLLPVNLSTFVAIIKFSFSMYTLLSKMKV